MRRPSTCHTFRGSSEGQSRSCHSLCQTSRSLSVVSIPRSRTRLRKSSKPTAPPSTFITPLEFAALPSAIRRKHFSPEEQYYIAAQLNPVILDAADEALYKQYQHYQGRQRSRSVDSLKYGVDADFESDNAPLTPAEEEWEDMDVRDLERLSWLDNDNDLDLKLDDYHTISADLNSKQSSNVRRRSFRRGLSFSNVSFRRRSSSSTSLQSPPPLGSNLNKGTSHQASPSFQPAHRSRDSTTSLDPSATHYQDPAAKMKLRVYLASPQKFDEALEFGFPSLQQEAVHPLGRPRTSPGAVNGQPKTFFSDDTPSLSEDESRDEQSEYIHQDSPRTPQDMSFPTGRPSQKSSTERSTQSRTRVIRDAIESYTYASAADREMTLRMTLTRPELRAIEDADHYLNPSQINERPLERAPLTSPVNHTGLVWDELPEEPSRVKRFFKKLKVLS